MIIRKGIIIISITALIIFIVGFKTTSSFQTDTIASNNKQNIFKNHDSFQQHNNIIKTNDQQSGNNNNNNDINNNINIIKKEGAIDENYDKYKDIGDSSIENSENYSFNQKNFNIDNFDSKEINEVGKLQNIINKLNKINENNTEIRNHKQKLPRFNKSNNPFNKIDMVYNKNKNKNKERAEQIKQSMKFAWDSYKNGAWGHDEWVPLENKHSDWLGGLGLTIVDSIDTLYLMGLEKEYNEAKDWISQLLLSKSKSKVSVFEVNIRYLGAFLTMYDYTGEDVYLNKAKEFGDFLMNAFSNKYPFPVSNLNLSNFKPSATESNCVVLAALGTMSLEFSRLSDITGDPNYKEKIDRIINAMASLETDIKGLYKTTIKRDASGYCDELISIGGQGDSYYEYLLKMWIYTDGEEIIYRDLFIDSADSIIKNLYKITKKDFGYIANLDYGYLVEREEHLTCFAGGMFALAAAANISGDDEKNNIYMEVGREVTKTCAFSYFNSPVGVGPEVFVFNSQGDISLNGGGGSPWYFLRPEALESIFILYRLTGDTMYQDWGWTIYEAIEKNCKVSNGYAGYKDIIFGTRDHVQQSFFMAETLKYLYLLYSDSNTVPLDKYVLNTEAHPLLIKYKN
ncbi:hypothetical protein DICPUDRAFT_157585 [Dictyostelium purpureum]|uniref:alpha-1,2-Mannosidase n=1 Tax=Dictyostelium purpureum TaxID=5786 RepID=F0ZZH9_DICPU|nr:uncharacterized protein DICPUDRAFT_157585 [Dictyostelium purpureum]EGC30650.1 hypothetical protein DICPUDRAFT_157585 [Dictyostelium purpureum]|eukprot:XP_003292831.1 hypothetical protein DICPUDRAFT_157585 [Dictyostelium purpureum]